MFKKILESSLSGGETGRLLTKKSQKGIGADEYPAYARFIEEAVCGYAVQVRISYFIMISNKNKLMAQLEYC